jgi:hypothetical protein
LTSGVRLDFSKRNAIFWLAWTWYLAACASQYHYFSGSLSARSRHSASSAHRRVTSFISNSRTCQLKHTVASDNRQIGFRLFYLDDKKVLAMG